MLAQNFYIDSSTKVAVRNVLVNNVAVASVVAGSGGWYVSLNATNRELVIKNLVTNDIYQYLAVVLAETTSANRVDATKLVQTLADGFGTEIVLTLPAGGWSFNVNPIALYMENSFVPAHVNNAKKVLDHSVNYLSDVRGAYASGMASTILLGMVAGVSTLLTAATAPTNAAASKTAFVSLCVRRGLDASLLANILGSTTTLKLNQIQNAMSADDSSVYLAYSDILHLFDVKDIMDPLSNFPAIVSAMGTAVSGGFAGAAVPAASALVGVNGAGTATGFADTFWFLCFTSLLDITAFAQLSVADPATLLSYIKTVPLFDFTTMTFVANGFVGNSKQFIFSPSLIQQAFGLSDSEIKQAIRDSGVNVV
jgi:hypothetical protein